MNSAAAEPDRLRTVRNVLAVLIAVVAIGVAATTGDSWAVRTILVLVAGDIVVRLWRR